jgi:hypothetical protein
VGGTTRLLIYAGTCAVHVANSCCQMGSAVWWLQWPHVLQEMCVLLLFVALQAVKLLQQQPDVRVVSSRTGTVWLTVRVLQGCSIGA